MRHGKGTDPEYTLHRLFCERAGIKRRRKRLLTVRNCTVTTERWPMARLLEMAQPTPKAPIHKNRHAIVVRYNRRDFLIDGSRRVWFWAARGKQWMRVHVCEVKPVRGRGAALIRERYRGRVARDYEKRRSGRADWRAEHAALVEFLNGIRPRSTVVDIPVGTGRFLTLYEQHDLRVTGYDISADMLKQAGRVATDGVILERADIFSLTGRFDVAVCVRFLDWLQPEEMSEALRILSAAADRVIVSIRLGKPRGHTPKEFARALKRAGLVEIQRLPLEKNGYFMIDLRHK